MALRDRTGGTGGAGGAGAAAVRDGGSIMRPEGVPPAGLRQGVPGAHRARRVHSDGSGETERKIGMDEVPRRARDE